MIDIFNNSYTAVAALILGFGFLIFVHELGHFAIAKWVGIRATQFAIGFGNAIVSYRKGIGIRVGGTEKEYIARALDALKEEGKTVDGLDEHARNQLIMEKADELGLGETEYRLNTLPLGGYVKMLGQEDMDPAAQSEDPRSFNKKSISARAAVISAGVVMNLIFGLIFFIICFQMGVKFPAAVVGSIDPDSAAATTYANGYAENEAYRGLLPGDHITHLNGKPITDMAEVRIATALGKGGKAVAMTVDREGEEQPLVFDIVATSSERNEGLLSAGIFPAQTLIVGESPSRPGEPAGSKYSPFAAAGVTPQMRMTAINGQPVDNQGQMIRFFKTLNQPQVTLRFESGDGKTPVEVQTIARPRLTVRDGSVVNLLGLTPPAEIDPAPGKPAEKAGVEPEDVIVRLGDRDWPAVHEVSEIVTASNGQPLALTVLRNGGHVKLGPVKQTRGGKIGVGIAPWPQQAIVSGVLPESLFAAASADRPLPAGSKLLSVAGQPVGTWADFQQSLHTSLSQKPESESAVTVELAFEINLGESADTETYIVSIDAEEAASLHAAYGWGPPGGIGFEPLMVEVKANGPVDATMIGIDKTGQFIQQTYITLLRLIQGTIGIKNLRGPVGIVDEGAKVAAQGFAYYLFFLGLISVNLAVLNFLPIPIVDGGLMVFLLIEKIKGSPASPQVQTAVALVGLVGLACVFLYVTFNDISRIVTG
ncbi:MAG: site-2 protease family protein [Planctomycetota bacterium]